jgi:hypothetical protein
MLFKVTRNFFLFSIFSISSKSYAFNQKNLTYISPSRLNIVEFNKKKKMISNFEMAKPSDIYAPEFYNKNELKDLFNFYGKIRSKVERPFEYKKVDMIQGIEMSFSPTFTSTNYSPTSFSDFVFSIEIKATFL